MAKSRDRQGGPPYFWSPRWRRRPWAPGTPRSRRQAAAPSPATSPCATPRHRRRPRRRARSGRCARHGTAPRKICIRPGSKNCSTRRSTPNRHGRRCAKCCATDRAISCSTIWGRRRRSVGTDQPRLRRSGVFLARLFRVQDGAAIRLLELLARRRRPCAEMLHVVDQSQSARGGAAAGLAAGFGAYLPVVADAVQSGAVRVLATDDNTDFYTVPLSQEALRPGTVYADPYGHVLMLVRRVPESGGRPAFSSPSTASPTARWRASVSGAAISCSPTNPRSAARASSASGRSCATQRQLAAADQCRDRQKSAVRRFFAGAVAAQRRGFLRSHGRRDVAGAARSGARHEGCDRLARRAGEDARGLDRERAEVPEQRQGRSVHAERAGDLRHQRRMGRFLDAGARFSSVDRHRRGARLPDQVARRPERYAMPKARASRR